MAGNEKRHKRGKKAESDEEAASGEEATSGSDGTRVVDLSLGGKNLDRLPEWVRDTFLFNFDLIAAGMAPVLKIDHLTAAGSGVIELKINGSPAYRCMYHLKTPGKVVVLHAAVKTKNGQDNQLIETTRKRYKKSLQGE